MAHYRTAQICENGHIITDDIQFASARMSKFCADCGAATITECPSCGEPIRGMYSAPESYSFGMDGVPSFCHACGAAFPWTKTRLEQAAELAGELEGLSDPEIAQLRESIPELSRDTPKTELATVRYKRIMAKAGGYAAGMLRDVVVSVATDAVKKHLGM